jgi:hypothetical protein
MRLSAYQLSNQYINHPYNGEEVSCDIFFIYPHQKASSLGGEAPAGQPKDFFSAKWLT